jgi:hypothetical protein
MALSSVGGRALCMNSLAGAASIRANSERALDKLRKVGKFFEESRRTAEADKAKQLKRLVTHVDKQAKRKVEEAASQLAQKALVGVELLGEEFHEEGVWLRTVDEQLRDMWLDASEHEDEIKAIKKLFEEE